MLLSEENENAEEGESQEAKIKEELSTMTFEELQKLKEKLGSKLYSQKYLGVNSKKETNSIKRKGKNQPREETSKKRPKMTKPKVPKMKEMVRHRDPRFDPICGTFDKNIFKTNYEFLNEVKTNEKKQLEEELKTTEDPDRKTQIKLLLQRITNQLRESKKTQKKEEQMQQEREEIKDQLKRGEKPIYKKKSDRRIEELVGQYEELKKTHRLDKHIEKRSRKLVQKEKKKMDM